MADKAKFILLSAKERITMLSERKEAIELLRGAVRVICDEFCSAECDSHCPSTDIKAFLKRVDDAK